MSTRPLRQYYEPVTATVPDVVSAHGPWLAHRRRFVDELRALPHSQWHTATRCTEWDVKGVVSHLVTVDQYWVFALGAARRVGAPTMFLERFDPSTATDAQVATLRDVPNAVLLDQFEAGTQSLVEIVQTFAPHEWDAIGESPLGHLPARLLFGHAFWDSWLHERDIFVPLGGVVPVEPDELLSVTCFCLLFAGLEGGLVDDEHATGARLPAPVDVRLRFDELPGTALRVEYDSGVHVNLIDPTTASAAGSAVALVDGFAGRCPTAALEAALPPDFAAHLGRAAQVL